MEDILRKARHEYYIKNKERINAVARERYYEKKKDPECYKRLLLKNQEAYHSRVNKRIPNRTEEEEEEYMMKIKRDIESIRELDKDRPVKPIPYSTIQKLFYD